MTASTLLLHAQRLQALAQAGLAYPSTTYYAERYEEIRAISVQLLHQLAPGELLEKLTGLPLAVDCNTASQFYTLFVFARNPNLPTLGG